MTAANYDIYIESGASWALDLVWQTAPGEPKMLTGYVAKAQVRQIPEMPGPAFLTMESPSEISLGSTTGLISLALDSVRTAGLSWSNDASWDLVLASSSGRVTRLVQGKAQLSPRVTQ